MPIHLSGNARKVLEVRYLQRDGSGQIIFTWLPAGKSWWPICGQVGQQPVRRCS
jgi:hypothetical protein